MPSSSGNNSLLARRVRKLERAIQPDKRIHWRAYLAECFAAPEYDEHRAAILEALCREDDGEACPCYSFTSAAAGYHYFIQWPDHKGPPLVLMVAADLAGWI